MDRSWIGIPRNTPEYLLGLNQFLHFAFTSGAIEDKIKCSCPLCGFKKWQTRNMVFHHFMDKDFPKHYVTWVMHGELNVLPNSRNIEVIQDAPPFVNPIDLLINEAFGGLRHEGVNTGPSQVAGEEETLHDLFDSNNKDYFELLKEGSKDLYEGSKYSKLEFLLKIYHIKCLSGLSDKGMIMVLALLRDAFKFAKIPIFFYEAKKIINKLCLNYIKIDVCTNDCMSYWEDDINAESCKHCHTSRWKPEKDSNLNYVPSTKDDNKDRILRHPRDSEAYKNQICRYLHHKDTPHPGPIVCLESQPSLSVHLTSHPSLVGRDSLQPSRSVHSTSYLGLANQDLSHSSRLFHSTSHLDPTNEDSSQAAPTDQAAPKKILHVNQIRIGS
ncbi:hypothetical protein BC332_11232 [Capsicum chinense]|nr:hypothetical protein BC332_11232 [Capsicum chinense]